MSQWLDQHTFFIPLLTFISGSLFTFLGNYIKFITEFNHIKSQLSLVLKELEKFSSLSEKHAKLETEIQKQHIEIKAADKRLSILEAKILYAQGVRA